MPFQDCICFRLGKAARKVTKAYREEIATHGLTHGQFFLLIAIMEAEGLLPSELAERTAQERPTITGLLDRLEKESWIERKPDPRDRRALRIYLGSRGKASRTALLTLFEETNQIFLDRLTPAEWAQMQSMLVKLEA